MIEAGDKFLLQNGNILTITSRIRLLISNKTAYLGEVSGAEIYSYAGHWKEMDGCLTHSELGEEYNSMEKIMKEKYPEYFL